LRPVGQTLRKKNAAEQGKMFDFFVAQQWAYVERYNRTVRPAGFGFTIMNGPTKLTVACHQI
jgi:hypothetical protein